MNKGVSTEYTEVSSRVVVKSLQQIRSWVWEILSAFILTVVSGCRAIVLITSRKLPGVVCDVSRTISSLAQADDVLSRVGDLDQKVSFLTTKPVQMPVDKVELFDNAVYRVRVLEVELLSVKKALRESLMKQDERQAYLDDQKAKDKAGALDGQLAYSLPTICHFFYKQFL